MNEYEKIRDLFEQEIVAVRKSLIEHPKRLSEYGKAYWEGNVAALTWALGEIADIHLSTQKVIEE